MPRVPGFLAAVFFHDWQVWKTTRPLSSSMWSTSTRRCSSVLPMRRWPGWAPSRRWPLCIRYGVAGDDHCPNHALPIDAALSPLQSCPRCIAAVAATLFETDLHVCAAAWGSGQHPAAEFLHHCVLLSDGRPAVAQRDARGHGSHQGDRTGARHGSNVAFQTGPCPSEAHVIRAVQGVTATCLLHHYGSLGP